MLPSFDRPRAAVKLRPFWSENAPPAEMSARLARALLPFWSMIREDAPFRVILAASVVMAAFGNCYVPEIW
jgi:hypothetical protein